MAEDLRRRCDLLFPRLGTPRFNPVDRRPYELDDRLSSFADPWVEVVNMFIARCTYLDETTGFGSSLFSPGDPPRVSFGGTCLPEDDRPS